jgi:hypothetical protein
MNSYLYPSYINSPENGWDYDWGNDTFKLALLGPTYIPSSLDETWEDIVAHEITSSGYSSGGISVSGLVETSSYISGMPNMVIGPLQTYPKWLVVYKEGASEATSPLIYRMSLNHSFVCANQYLKVDWPDGKFISI